MSKDKLFYSYLGAWNSNIIEYSKLFPNSILLHKRKKAIINNGLIYGGVGSLPIVYGYDHDVVGVWTGNSDDITEYTEGMSIIYVPGVEGSTNTTLNINGLGSHNILINNSNLVKQYKVGCPIILVYIKGVWRISDYYTNDVNLINETTSTSAYYLTMTNQKSGELYSYSNAKIYFQNNTLYSPRFNGSLTGNASSADKFSQGKKINGTTFDNTIDITTTYWGNERKFSISDNSSSYCGSYVLVHGDKDITIKLPSNIVAEKFFGSFIGPLSGNVTGNVTGNVSGNSSTATKLKNSHTLWGQTFNGTQDVSGNISNTGNIVPSEDLTYNIGLTTSRYNNIYASHLIGRADTVTSSKDNTTKIYFVGVTGANQALKFDENIYTSTTSGNLHSSRLYINTSTENINYRFYTTGDGYISGKLIVNGDDGITSKKFVKEGSNNTYVLLGGGGQLLLSELFSGDDVSLYTGGDGNLTQNVAATNGNVHLTLKSKSTYYKHNLVGSNGIEITSDANGKITFKNTALLTQYTTGLFIGESTTKANKSVTDPYLKLFDDNTLRNEYRFIGGSNVTITSDVNGNITIDSSYVNTDTHWIGNLHLGAKDTLTTAATSNGSTYLKFTENGSVRADQILIKGTGITTVSSDANGVLTINTNNPNTHYKTGFYIGETTTKVNKAITNPYLKIFDDNTLRGEHQLIGGSNVTITSDANGHITIDSSYVNTDTHWTGNLRLGVKDTLTTAATSNGSTYLKFTENGSVRADQILIKGTGITTVSSDANGVLTINTNNPNTHYTTGFYIGESSTKANKSVIDPYLKLFDDNTLRGEHQLIGGSNVTITSDANGNITIDSSYVNTDTHWTGNLRLGAKDTLTTAATSNGSTYLKFTENGSVRTDQILIKGTGCVSVSSDANGVLTINGVDTNTHYTTSLYIGESTTKANKNITNPYLKLFDNNSLRNQYQVKGGSNVTITSDANGNITIDSTYSDTHWTSNLYVGAKDTKTNASSSTNGGTWLKLVENNTLRTTQVNLVGTGIATVTNDASGKISINVPNTNSHYATGFFVGESTTKANKAITNPYLKIFDDNTLRGEHQLIGGSNVTITSDANGNITIDSSYVNTDTHWTGNLRLGAKDTLTTAATSNGNTYLKFTENGSVRADQILIKGTGITTVSSDANGVLTINTNNPNTHFTTTLFIGEKNTKANKAITSPYIKLFDNNTLRSQYLITGGNDITVTSDANGNITIDNNYTAMGTFLPLAGGQMKGNITWKDSTALPENTTPEYFLTITAFASGGNTKWASKANTLKALTGLTSTAIGSSSTPIYWDGSKFVTSTAIHEATTGFYIGEATTKANKNITNPYLKIFDDNTLRNQYQIKGGSNVTVTSDANGNITITSSYSDTHWTGNLHLGAKDTITTAATSNGSTYLKFVENNTLRSNQILIKGTGCVSVSSDANGVLTINGIDTDTHYTTSLYIGEATTKANKAITSPYIKIFDNNTLRNQYQFKGGTGISVASDANGNVTITNTAPDTDTKVNQSETTTSNWRGIVLGYNNNGNPNTGITSNVTNVVYTSNKLTFQPSTGNISTQGNIIIDTSHSIRQKQGNTSNYTTVAIWLKNGTGWYKSDGTTLYTQQPQIGQHNTGDTYGTITILPYATDTNAWSGSVGLYIGKTVLKWENKTILHSSNYTSYVDYYIYIGEANTNANKAITNPYIKLYNLSTKKSQHQVKGNNNITVTSDASGNITIQDTLTYLYVGASNTASHAAVTSNPYIKLYDGLTRRSEVQIKGSGGTTVSSDASGNITISSGTTSHTHQIKINGTTYTIPYTGAVDCGRYITASGFANGGSTSLSSWGTLTTANGYTGVLNINDPDGGSWEIAYKGGQQFHQIDGYYYQNEGRYRVTDVTETVTALGTSGNYITWTKNGSTNNLLVPYATNADTLDGIHASGLFTNFSNAGSQTTSITIGGTNKTLKIDADLLDGYHASNLYTSIGDWIGKVGNTKTVTVGGDANTYYPVVISSTYDKTSINIISIWKNLGSSTASYPGNHSNGTSSMWLVFEGRSCTWDGNGGYYRTIYKAQPYATLISEANIVASSVSVLCVYLRGGGTEYNISTTYPANVTVYLSSTNIGSSTYPANVTPRTDIGNGGIINGTFYGNITGNADTVDGYHASGLFTVFGNSGNNITATIGGTVKTFTVNYATNSGNADTVDGYHASGLFTVFGNSGNNITATIGGTTKTFTVNYATNSTSTEYLNNYTISDPNAAKKDNKVKWFAQINSSSGYAGNNYGFPVSNNANGILYLGTHPGEYGHQLGFSSNGSIYRRYQNGSAFPTTANGGSWLRILDSGNSSVSGGGSSFGSSITVTINGITKTLTIPSNPNTDYRVTQNSDSTNTEYRLLFKYSANDTNETTTVKYNTKFRYNPSTGNIFNNGNLFIDTGDNDRYIHFRYNSNNYAGASWRLISRGSGSGDTNYFDIETGGSGSSNNTWYRVIRLTMDNRYVGIGTDSPSSKLHVNGGLLKITNNSNTVTIGSANSSWCHFENSADIPFYFNKAVHVNGDIRLYNGTAWIQSSNGHIYTVGYHHRSHDNDNALLLAGGGWKLLSDLAVSAHTHKIKLGGTEITIPASGMNTYTGISGPFYVDTNADSNKAFSIRRGSDGEAVKHWVDDSQYHIDYTNDETSSSIHIRVINTDTESPHDPRQTTDYHYYLDCYGNIYPGSNNTGSIGTSSYKWGNMYATTFHGSLDGNASTATKLQTTRNLKVNLASSASQLFDGSADATSIGISGTLPFGNLPTMYWANIQVKTTSDTGTTPQFGYVGIGRAPSNTASLGRLVFPANDVAINFRVDHSSYYSKIQYMTTGNEALVFSNKNAVTSFIFKCGYDLNNGSDWRSSVIGTPSVQIKNQSLYVNTAISDGSTPGYNFYVSGNSRLDGNLHIFPGSNSNWSEGLRIHSASNGWTTLMFCGTDNTGDNGTNSKSWSFHTYDSNFYLNKNNSSTATANRLWARSGGGFTFGNTSNATYTIESAGGIRIASDWFRIIGSGGIYWETYGGGWNMTDTTYVRIYNGKYLYTTYQYYDVGNQDYTIDHIYASNDKYIRPMEINTFISKITPLINNNDTVTFTKSLKVTEAWMDTGITTETGSGKNFPQGNGTYVVQISHDSLTTPGTNGYASIYSGIITIYNGTNATDQSEEIILHRSGHAWVKRLYLRTVQTASSTGYCKIQISASSSWTEASNVTFKFRKLI